MTDNIRTATCFSQSRLECRPRNRNPTGMTMKTRSSEQTAKRSRFLDGCALLQQCSNRPGTLSHLFARQSRELPRGVILNTGPSASRKAPTVFGRSGCREHCACVTRAVSQRQFNVGNCMRGGLPNTRTVTNETWSPSRQSRRAARSKKARILGFDQSVAA